MSYRFQSHGIVHPYPKPNEFERKRSWNRTELFISNKLVPEPFEHEVIIQMALKTDGPSTISQKWHILNNITAIMTPIHDGRPLPGPSSPWLMIKLSTNTQPIGAHRISGSIKSHSIDLRRVAHRFLFSLLKYFASCKHLFTLLIALHLN